MATITLPNTRAFMPARAEFGLQAAVFESPSPLNFATQTVDTLAARWAGTITFTARRNTDLGPMEALFARLRGKANRLAMGHPLRRVPAGTMRGTPTLNGSHAALATSLNITGSGTLKAGDMLGVGGELVMVTADATVSGVVSIAPALRTSKTAGTSVVWDWPLAVFIVTSDVVRIPFEPRVSPAFSIDFVEVFG